jgi:hypothetical protein
VLPGNKSVSLDGVGAANVATKGDMILNCLRIRASLIADLLVFAFLLASGALAQTRGTFTPTGAMTTPRTARPKQQIVTYAHSWLWLVLPWPPYLGS